MLCIRRTLADGRLIGFFSGLGAASADMFYGAVAAFGLTAIQTILVGQQFWLHLLGGFFLLYLGIRTFFTKPAKQAGITEAKRGLFSAYLSTFGLTLTNPATIISFGVVFAGLQPGGTNGNYLSASLLVSGVFFGSAIWWLTLSGIVDFIREKFAPEWMTWINRLAGLMIFAFGVAALVIAN